MAQHDRSGVPGPAEDVADAKVRARALAMRIPLLYLLFGILWILFSDRTLALLATDTAALTRLQSWKGAITVGISAALLYVLTYRLLHRLLRAADRARASENRRREMFEANPNPMFSCDMQSLEIVDANPAAADFLGWPREHLRGMAVGRLWRDREELAAAGRDPAGFGFDVLVHHRGDDRRWREDVAACRRLGATHVTMAVHRLGDLGTDALLAVVERGAGEVRRST